MGFIAHQWPHLADILKNLTLPITLQLRDDPNKQLHVKAARGRHPRPRWKHDGPVGIQPQISNRLRKLEMGKNFKFSCHFDS